MNRHFFFLVIVFSLLLAACNLPSPAPEADSEAAPSAAPSVAPTLTSPPPTAPPAPTQTLLDPCLLGVWTMDVYALNNKLLDLTQSSAMYVIAPSIMTLEFRDDNSFSLNGQVTVRSDIPGGGDYMELDGYHTGGGSYAADGELLSLLAVDYMVEYGTMRVYINGVLNTGPFNTGAPPENMMTPPSDSEYRCSGNSLEITFAGPLGPVTEEWRK